MGSRLGRRVIHFANLPIKLLMPSSFQNIKEIALKTIPSATKVEIKRVLQNLYGFDVEEVRTLNMEGKKKKRGGILIAKPDYKKAYVTLKTPLSLSPDLYPIRFIEEEKKNTAPKKSQSGVVEDRSTPSHWLDGEGNADDGDGIGRGRRFKKTEKRPVKQGDGSAEKSKFPWSSMRSWRCSCIRTSLLSWSAPLNLGEFRSFDVPAGRHRNVIIDETSSGSPKRPRGVHVSIAFTTDSFSRTYEKRERRKEEYIIQVQGKKNS